MATLWTTAEDVKKRFPDNAPTKAPSDEKLETYIEDIETQILQRFPNIQARIDANTLNQAFVTQTTAQWIIEYIQRGNNPFAQESQSYTGAAARSTTFDSKSRKNLILSKADLDIFLPQNQGKNFSLSQDPEVVREPYWWRDPFWYTKWRG